MQPGILTVFWSHTPTRPGLTGLGDERGEDRFLHQSCTGSSPANGHLIIPTILHITGYYLGDGLVVLVWCLLGRGCYMWDNTQHSQHRRDGETERDRERDRERNKEGG